MRKLLLLAATVGLLVAGHPVLAQIDMKAMTMMDGQCRAEIETRAVACQPAGTFVEFGNGRSLFLFSREGTLYGFSGSHSQRRSGQTFALIVDMVRIASQTAPERDLADMEGECVVQTEANSERFTAIDCHARSRQNARYRFVLDHHQRRAQDVPLGQIIASHRRAAAGAASLLVRRSVLPAARRTIASPAAAPGRRPRRGQGL